MNERREIFGAVVGAAAALAAMLGATTARADGECDKGYRDTTAAERETMMGALDAAVGALPPAPEGWVIVNQGDVSVTRSLCQDTELEPWGYGYTRYYSHVAGQEERNAMVAAAAADSAADLAAKQPRLDAIMAHNTELSQALIAAVQAGDYARIEPINQEIEAGSEEYQRILDEGPAQQRANEAAAASLRDIEMSVSIEINPRVQAPDDAAQSLTAPAGAHSAFRWSDTSGDRHDGHALVLLGEWKAAEHGGLELVPRAGVAAEAPHGIAVAVTADEDRLAATLDSIDFGALAKLLRE